MRGELKYTQKKVWVRNFDRKGQSFGLPSCDVCSFEIGYFVDWILQSTETGHWRDLIKMAAIFFCFEKALNFVTAF